METWRIIATTLLVISGIVGVLIVTAKVRERTDRGTSAAVAALVSFTTLVVLGVLTITVLPAVLTWAVAIAVTVAVAVGLLAS